MVRPIVLWSDGLIFLLVLAILAMFRLVKTNPQTTAKWRQVFSTKLGCSTFMVIAIYVFIALLDSLHFQKPLPTTAADEKVYFSSEVLSVLDWIHEDMRVNKEKTYSAPFALHSFAKENMRNADGSLYRDHPRLLHGGIHLHDANDRWLDICKRSLVAFLKGGFFAFAIILLVAKVFRLTSMEADLPTGTIYTVVCITSIVYAWILELGSVYHIMGTDKVGADVLYQSIKSIRTGVLIGAFATLLSLPFAIGLGISAGYFKGRVDDLVQYIYTTLSSIPDILLIAAAVLVIDVYIENLGSERYIECTSGLIADN